jgi:uncharacterized protein YfeS
MTTVACRDIKFTVRFDQAYVAGKVRHVLQRAHLQSIDPYSERITALPSAIYNGNNNHAQIYFAMTFLYICVLGGCNGGLMIRKGLDATMP